MSNMIKENFGESPSGEVGLKVAFRAAGAGVTPVDANTGKRLSRPQMEYAKSQPTVDAVRVVVTS